MQYIFCLFVILNYSFSDSPIALKKSILSVSNSTVKEIKSSYGYLKIDTVPQGMDVYLSGKLQGKTPMKRLKAASGNHKLTFKDPSEEYQDYSTDIKVKKFDLRNLKYYMLKASAKIFLVGEGKGRVLINGYISKYTAPGLIEVPVGKVLIQIAAFKKGFQQQFNLKANQELEVEYNLSSENVVNVREDSIKSIEMVKIPAGSFVMGSPKSESRSDKDERPLHKVHISKSFSMGKYEVTQKQYKMIMGYNPSQFKGDNLPVENVNWFDIQKFLINLNYRVGCSKVDTLKLIDESGLDAVPRGCFRLPTEAEWEYAARAGTSTAFSFGNSVDSSQAKFDSMHPYGGGKKSNYKRTSFPVGSFSPNKFGLYDMHGNIVEWCHDWYDPLIYMKSFYKNSAKSDPVNIIKGYKRIVRGGGWGSNGRYLRSGNRSKLIPSYRNSSYGFRLVVIW